MSSVLNLFTALMCTYEQVLKLL